jgi:hypothetical protein
MRVFWAGIAALIPLLYHSPNCLAQADLKPAGVVVAADSNAGRGVLQRKNPKSAMLRSLAVPGWGQVYNGNYFKGALAFGAEIILVRVAIYWNQQAARARGQQTRFFSLADPLPKNSRLVVPVPVRAPDREAELFYLNNRNTAYWFLLATIVFSMLDAYVDASLADFDESPDLSLTPSGDRSNGLMLTIKIKL